MVLGHKCWFLIANIGTLVFFPLPRYAGEAENLGLAMIAARHFWNACLPFIASSVDRQLLKKPTEIILKSIMKAAEAKNKQVRNSSTLQLALYFYVLCFQTVETQRQNIG